MTPGPERASFWKRLYLHRHHLPVLAAATFWLFVSWLAIDILPFRLYRYLLHPRLRPSRHPDESAVISSVRKVIKFASRGVPWRSVCFHEGIAAQQMLRHRGIASTLHFGVAHSPKAAFATQAGFASHVWVTCAATVVVGGPATGFTELASFHDWTAHPGSL